MPTLTNAGLERETPSRYEGGSRMPTPRSIDRLARRLVLPAFLVIVARPLYTLGAAQMFDVVR